MQRHTPKYTLGKWIEPTRVFIAVLLAAAFWLAPVAFAPKETQATNSPLISIAEDAHTQTLPGGLQVASAQGCGACQEFGCVEWINNEYPEDGSDWTTCIVHGCVPIPACVPIPPTATLNVICDTPGQNGWCRGGSKAEFTVINSQGQTFIISGNVNGNNFACPTGQSDCTIPLPEGTGTVTYVVSTNAGFTNPYSAAYQVDATTPQIDGNINGSVGTSGWYTSEAEVSASASDAGSGIATLEASLDGGTWSTVNSPLSVSDGIHTIQYRATDNAGNQTETAVQQIKVDTTIPVLNVAMAGNLGSNQWYLSTVTLTPTASDAVSGLAALEVSIDGGSYANYQSPITFTDGIHTVQFRATDQAGNISQTTAQEIKVDTITPSLSLSKSGTAGLNGWYVSNVSVTPNASDGGSGIHKIEAMIDGGTWSIVNGPLSFVDGIHSYQIRVSDNAGNQTQTPIQTVQVDTLAPALNAPSTIGLVTPLPYQINDPGSGLAWFQIAIDDKEGVLPTVVQTWGLTGTQTQGEYWWDGKVGGSVTANVGSYPYRLTTADQAGNQTTMSGVIEVEWKDLLYLELIPSGDNTPLNSTGVIVLSNPVTSNATPSVVAPTPEASFGGQGNGVVVDENPVVTVTGGEKVFEGLTLHTSNAVSFTAGNETTSTPFDNPNILWGAAATALLGATLAEWQKKKEEEAALLALIAARDSGGREDEEEIDDDWLERKAAQKLKKTNPGLAHAQAQTKAVKAAIAQVTAQEQKQWERDRTAKVEATDRYKESENKGQYLKQELQNIRNAEAAYREEQKEEQAKAVNQKAKIDTDEERLEAYKETASYQARQESYADYYAQKEQEKQNAVNAARWAGLASVAQAKENNKSWWEGGVDWINQHQVETSIAVGIAVGVTAIILSGGAATPLVAAAWVAGAATAAGGTIALGTVGLNAYYGRPLGTNVAQNFLFAGGAAAVVTGVGLLLPLLPQSIGTYCAVNQTICANVEPVLNVIDTGEQVLLGAKGSYQTWIGDTQGAAETAIELQTEMLDGGMPGNSLSNEAAEQLAKLGNDVPELLATYGDDIIPLLLKYQDDAVDIIGAYGDEGITLLQKYGGDTPQTIKLVREYGTPAVELLNKMDVESVSRVLKNPDAVSALLRWKPEDFKQFGVELVLRAENDAKALTALDKLTKLDINSSDPAVRTEVNRLIQEIAENSTQGGGERFVLGNWVSHGDGYVADARVNGGIWYESHPDIYNKLEAVYGKRDPRIDEALWQINQAALQKQIDEGVDFDYSLTSIKIIDDYNKEIRYVELLESGNVTEVLDELRRDSLPARLKEVQLLLDAGYTPNYDNAAHVIHWTLEP